MSSAVRGVTFTVAGASTSRCSALRLREDDTLRAIAGLERPTSGEIRIGGSPMFSSSPSSTFRPSGAGSRWFPVLRHLAAHERVRQRGLRAPRAQAARAEIAARVREALDWCSSAISPRAALEALRRPAAARRARPRVRVLALGAALRRAAVQPRRQAARRDARRDQGAAAAPRHHLGVRDPRPRGGAGDLRPDHRHARRRIEQVGSPGEIYDRRARRRGRLHRLCQPDPRPAVPRPGGDGPSSSRRRAAPSCTGSRRAGAAGPRRSAVRTVHLGLDRRARGGRQRAAGAHPQRVFQGDFTQYHVDWNGQPLIVRSAAAEPWPRATRCSSARSAVPRPLEE